MTNAAVEKLPRKWPLRIVCLAVVAIILFATAPYSLGWLIGQTLQSQLTTRMRGTLQFKRVIYRFPYGVQINDAHLSMVGTSNCSVDFDRLKLALGKLPLGHGPLLIERLEIENPTVRLAGFSNDQAKNSVTAPDTSMPQKLSDLFQLKSVKVTGGQVEYDWSSDHRSEPPMIWEHLDAAIQTRPAEAAKYQFSLSVDDKPLATANADGSFNIDSLQLNVDHLTVAAACDPKQPAPLPPIVLDVIQNLNIGGQLTINGSASVPLRTPGRSNFAAEVSLKNGRCQPPGWTRRIGPVQLSCSWSNPSGEAYVRVNSLRANCDLQSLTLSPGGELTFNPRDKTWAIRKMQGSVDLGNSPDPLLGNDVKMLVPFVAAGNGKWGEDTPAVRFAFDRAAVRLTANPVLIDRINGMLTLTPGGLSSTGLSGNCAGGRVKMVGILNWDQPGPLIYHGQVNISKVDLHKLAVQHAQNPSVAREAVGELDLNVKYWTARPRYNSHSDADWLRAKGDVDINHGYFLDIPVLKEVLGAMHNPSASVLGEAAFIFDIEQQIVTFKRVAVSSPTLGVQGSGTLGFDQKLNMVFVATPLADWSKDIKNTGLPFLGHLARVAGRLQSLVNKTQSAVLYQFRVSGDVSQPQVRTIPVPILTDNMISLFDRMSGDQSAGTMGEELKKQ